MGLRAASAFSRASTLPVGNGGNAEDEIDGSGGAVVVEPISIPLEDILSVDEEIPSTAAAGLSGSGRRGRSGGSNMSLGSDFFRSIASDVEAAREAAEAAATAATTSGDGGEDGNGMGAGAFMQRPGSASPPPPHTASSSSLTNNGGGNGKVPHRIFLHTLSHGYVEFTLDNANSHDVFMAYLKAHLEPDRVPQRDLSGSQHNAAKNTHGGSGGQGTLLRTMVLTPTSEVPSNLSSSSKTLESAKSSSKPKAVTTAPTTPTRAHIPRPNLLRSRTGDSTTCSARSVNNIDKLHSKAMHKHLRSESTVLQRAKDNIVDWMSNMCTSVTESCGCCQDTTTVAPIEMSDTPDSKMGAKKISGTTAHQHPHTPQRSPRSERLRGRGIGGLSFEELSMTGSKSPAGTPNNKYLSFEQAS